MMDKLGISMEYGMEKKEECYEAWLPLDFLPPEARFVYRNTNNMELLDAASCCAGLAPFVTDVPSQDVIVVENEATSDYILISVKTSFRRYGNSLRNCIDERSFWAHYAGRLDILERAAKCRLKNALPENLRPFNWPYVFSGTVNGKKALLLLNTSGQAKEFPFSNHGLPEICSEKLIGLGIVRKGLTLSSHNAALIIAEI